MPPRLLARFLRLSWWLKALLSFPLFLFPPPLARRGWRVVWGSLVASSFSVPFASGLFRSSRGAGGRVLSVGRPVAPPPPPPPPPPPSSASGSPLPSGFFSLVFDPSAPSLWVDVPSSLVPFLRSTGLPVAPAFGCAPLPSVARRLLQARLAGLRVRRSLRALVAAGRVPLAAGRPSGFVRWARSLACRGVVSSVSSVAAGLAAAAPLPYGFCLFLRLPCGCWGRFWSAASGGCYQRKEVCASCWSAEQSLIDDPDW